MTESLKVQKKKKSLLYLINIPVKRSGNQFNFSEIPCSQLNVSLIEKHSFLKKKLNSIFFSAILIKDIFGNFGNEGS